MIELPETAINTVLDYAGQIVGEFFPLLALILGISLAFYILSKVINIKKENS